MVVTAARTSEMLITIIISSNEKPFCLRDAIDPYGTSPKPNR